MLLFTYGTLKKGQQRESVLSRHKFLGKVSTNPEFKLFHNSSYPCLVVDEENGYSVNGELYEVDDDSTWKRLDQIEGVGFLYDRKEIEVTNSEGEIVTATTYVFLRETDNLTESGSEWPPNSNNN